MCQSSLCPDSLSPSSAARLGCVLYVTPDCTDSAVQKRAYGFLATGVELISFSFRRARYNVDFVPDWPNVELGSTTERRLITRAFSFLRALRVISRHRRRWREASLIYARNLDLALMSLVARLITGCRAPLVYEVLDVHPAMTQAGLRAILLRWLERRVLKRCRLLVVSSPAFVREYFTPRQNYQGEWFLLENKWPHAQIAVLPRILPRPTSGPDGPWVIGWFGNIRCSRSIEILSRLAKALGDRVRIYIRGCASLLGEDNLQREVGEHNNVVFEGEYVAPRDLPALYSGVHFNWCADLDGGQNSVWLLPNRIYEGGYFGIPALAIANHETGRVVSERQWGIALEDPVEESLQRLLSHLTVADYEQMRRRLESLPEEAFVDRHDMTRLLRAALPAAGDEDRSRILARVQDERTE